MKIPQELLYSKTHEWARQENDTVVVGITDYAQHELGDIVFLELPAAGKTLERGASFGSIESVKSVSDLIAPVSGQVQAVNEDAKKAPECVNADPYGKGWMIRVKPSKPEELKELLKSEQYRQHTGEEN